MAQINIKVDDELKEKSAKILADLGLDLTTGVRIFLNQVVREEGIPFEVTLRKSIYQQALEDKEHGRVKSFSTVEDLFKDLESDED